MNLTEKEKQEILKQHQEAKKVEQQKTEEVKKGLQAPDKKNKT